MERDAVDYFREIIQKVYLESESKLEKYGLVKGQAQLLLLIRDNEGCTQKDLANYYNVKYSSMSERLNRLEAAGFITRQHEDGNFKNNRIYMTATGKAAAVQCRRAIKDLDAKMFKGISKKDQAQFEKILIKMLSNI